MVIYCDKLSLFVLWKSVRLNAEKVHVLDEVERNLKTNLLLRISKVLGIIVNEEFFNDGQIKNADGRSVGVAARDVSTDIVLTVAKKLLNKDQRLQFWADKFGAHRLALYIAKSIWSISLEPIRRVMVAEYFANNRKNQKVTIIVHAPLVFEEADFQSLISGRQLIFKRNIFEGTLVRLLSCLKILKSQARVFKNRYRKKNIELPLNHLPSLLLLQEDELSLDRLRRGQPHWLSPNDPVPDFNTFILKTSDIWKEKEKEKELSQFRVTTISWLDMGLIPETDKDLELKRELNKFKNSIRSGILFSSGQYTVVYSNLEKLVQSSRLLVNFCGFFNVKAFMTCENYIHWSDAMELIAKKMNIKTLSYQYSCLRSRTVALLTTCEKMMTFSPHYRSRWKLAEYSPQSFEDVGYLYDYAFEPLTSRSKILRHKLAKNGVEFVMSYFDETVVWNKKYGVLNQENYENEFLEFAQYVLDDKSCGLVIKSQFQFNKVSQFKRLVKVIAQLEKEGRCVQLSRGSHRNVILPAEAALAADIAIGNLVGGTAVLEAALAGVRSVIINNYGVKTDSDDIYAQADIIYPTAAEALKAMTEFRKGDLKRSKIGDWSAIIGQLDPYRDGRAYKRMRQVIEQSVLR